MGLVFLKIWYLEIEKYILLSENCFLIQEFFVGRSFLSAVGVAVFVGWKFFVVESF